MGYSLHRPAAEIPLMYDWTEEKLELHDKTVEDQRAILAKWVKDIVWEMGCTCREAEKFLTTGVADVLKPGYETFIIWCCDKVRTT